MAQSVRYQSVRVARKHLDTARQPWAPGWLERTAPNEEISRKRVYISICLVKFANMTAEKSNTNTTKTAPPPAATSGIEKKDAATPDDKKTEESAATTYRSGLKQWFVALSPEERFAALGFKDSTWTAFWTQVVRAARNVSSLESGSNGKFVLFSHSGANLICHCDLFLSFFSFFSLCQISTGVLVWRWT